EEEIEREEIEREEMSGTEGGDLPAENPKQEVKRRKRDQRYIIVAESGDEEPFGFEVDEVNQVEDLDRELFQPIEDLSHNANHNSICSHLMLKEQETVLIIDGTRIMQSR
ncbi:MAG: hypothetical protein HN623_11645, partial [Bdellovibrionales bacterium]|nr:hypothetical protein [Bdellovibrionales bacterium]